MNSRHKLLLRVLQKEKTKEIPFWFMRQAGRYLPEYRQMRSEAKSFLDFCYTPKASAEVTLQPIRRFGMDGAIIFSDILVIPHALGAHVQFEEGTGPVLKPIRADEELAALSMKGVTDRLSPVYEAIALTKAMLPENTTLIGFAGAPWTLACYMIEGRGSRDFQQVRQIAMRQREFFINLLSILTDAVILHLGKQIEAGAEVVQLFDSWAGVLSEAEFTHYCILPAKKITTALKAKYPKVPIIGFPRMSGGKYAMYAREVGMDAVSIDASVSLEGTKELQKISVLQGNLDPVALAENKEAMLTQARQIISTLGDKPFVFNLGHGILPHTPVEHLQALCDLLRTSTLKA